MKSSLILIVVQVHLLWNILITNNLGVVNGNIVDALFGSMMRRPKRRRKRRNRNPVPAPTIQLPLRLNCGNATKSYLDPETGFTWNTDAYYVTTSNTLTNNLCQSAAAAGVKLSNHLCQSRSASTIRYNIPVPANGQYKVTLFFVELVQQAISRRIFTVSSEDITLLSRLDIFAITGGRFRTLSRSFTVNVADRILSIEAVSELSGVRATINAIQVEAGPTLQLPVPAPVLAPVLAPIPAPVLAPKSSPVQPPPPQLSTIRINCGGFNNWTDPLTNKVWMGDLYYRGGYRHLACPPKDILNTKVDEVHCSERNWFGSNTNGTYIIPVVHGKYTVRLMFAEIFFKQAKLRTFNIFVQHQVVRRNFDIFGESGGANISTSVSYIASTASPTDSNIYITLQNILQNAKLSAIEILPFQSRAPSPPTPKPSRRPTQKPSTDEFQNILINCGYDSTFMDSLGQTWLPDRYFTGGLSNSKIMAISNTVDDELFQYYRSGDSFKYQIPLPVGTYAVVIHLAETEYVAGKQRVFDIQVEEQIITVDIFQLAGGAKDKATRIQFFQVVEDGFLSIQFRKSIQFPNAGVPVVSAIEIILDKPHIAHAVATGPYQGAVTIPNTNKGSVQLIGQTSHTHGDGLGITSYTWKEGNTVIGNTMNSKYDFTAGIHTVALTIRDSGGNVDTEVTTVTVRQFGYPAISSITPNTGSLEGTYKATIVGTGFNYGTDKLKVRFGQTEVSSTSIKIIDSTKIEIVVPASSISQDVSVTIQTPIGTSSGAEFSYIGSIPIQWQEGLILEYLSPAVGRFAQDRKLYIGTRRGRILKITMNEDFTVAINTIVSLVNPDNQEAVLGITTDPLDMKKDPDIYFTSNRFFHKGNMSSSGLTVSGKIRRASGPNLETVIDIVTGLPVSDFDHGLCALEFGDNGQLYFTSGAHTNGGIPGAASSSKVLKENFLSAAVNVAYLSHPNFDGNIKWSQPDDGNMIARGIDVFAPGFRNAYGIVLHTNGFLYGTDNSANRRYGRMATGCNGESIDDEKRDDEINLIEKGKYYGQPNLKRAKYFNQPNQCVWNGAEQPTTATHTAPLMTHPSSIDGILEYHGEHFDGQLRSNLIYIQYNAVNNIYRVALSPDGRAINSALNKKGVAMNIGNLGLDITQAPNGNLIEMRYPINSVHFYRPIEPATTDIVAKTCFPRRGPTSGGNLLSIYGVNFNTRGASVTVLVGGRNCPTTYVSNKRIDCTLPGGTGTVDITVTNNGVSSTFKRGYRYISGTPQPGFVLPAYTG